MDATTKVAVVTGAGSGIGKRTALAFLEEGYSVTLAGRRRKPLDGTLAVPMDVSDPDGVGKLFARTREAFGRIDVLFNNAGIFGPSGLFEEIPYDEWKAVMDINITGAFLCARKAFRRMKRQQPGGTHHQQRLHIGPRPTPQFSRLHNLQACHHRSHQNLVPGRSQV